MVSTQLLEVAVLTLVTEGAPEPLLTLTGAICRVTHGVVLTLTLQQTLETIPIWRTGYNKQKHPCYQLDLIFFTSFMFFLCKELISLSSLFPLFL